MIIITFKDYQIDLQDREVKNMNKQQKEIKNLIYLKIGKKIHLNILNI